MTIKVQSADGNVHEFPDDASQEAVDRAMKDYTSKSSSKVEEGMSAGGRFVEGMVDPVYGAKQLYAHVAGSDEDAASADKQIQDREEYIKRRSGVEGVDYARMGGRMVPALAIGAAAGPVAGGGVVAAGLSGAVDSLLNPVSGGNYVEQKINQALVGTAFGVGGGAVPKIAGSLVGPTVREAAKDLMSKGVQLTPGQIAGGILRRAEEASKSFPILGSFIRGAEGRSIETFNRATIDQALAPIGVKIPASAKPGHEAITYARLRLDDAYDSLLPKTQLAMDTELASDISNVRFLSSELPESQAKQFDTILHNRVQKHFTDTGAITGERLKAMESELNSIASQYRASADGGQRQLAQSLDDVRGAIRDALERQNPEAAGELKKINAAYAMFTRVESAAARRAGSQGVFTPGDLLQSIKSADKSVRKGQFARGDALMQEFAEFADTVLPSKMPDSGTTERAMWDMLGIGSAIVNPKIPIALGAASLPYTKMASGVVNKIAQPGPVRSQVGRMIKKSTPYVGSAASPMSAVIDDTNDIDNVASRAAGEAQ